MFQRLKRLVIGAPRDVEDPHIHHKISLIAFLAWIGLGADGLSSSAYGPDEAFRALGTHTELAIFLAIATALTVFVISYAYSRIIEHFPTGGGGYVVATKLLGAPAGVVSGSALLVDYVLTITVSIASGADAIFAFLPKSATFMGVTVQDISQFKLPVEYMAIVLLLVMNLRGAKESIMVLVPIFLLFIATHAIMLMAAFIEYSGHFPAVFSHVTERLNEGVHDPNLGLIGLFLIFGRAYSMGAGTFTGIEAVSNGLAIMRDPKVETGKRTMIYMATSLAVTAGGILLAYLLLGVTVMSSQGTVKAYDLSSLKGVQPQVSVVAEKVSPKLKPVEPPKSGEAAEETVEDERNRVKLGQVLAAGDGWSLNAENDGTLIAADNKSVTVKYDGETKPLNAVLLERLCNGSRFFGNWFVVLTLVAEALLLVIAAQTGFIDGPRVMANMALDSWLPHRFSSLSERLTTHYGVLIIGFSALAALWYTGGAVETLVVMYSINVFITFSLTELGMCRFYITHRKTHKEWSQALPIHMTGLVLCTSILTLVVYEKFLKGAWVTLIVTLSLIAVCFMIRRYYTLAYRKLGLLSVDIELPKDTGIVPPKKLDPKAPVAVLLVGGYGGLGVHSFLEILRQFPDHFKQIIFVSVAVVDSGRFKGADEVDRLKQETEQGLEKYVKLARRFGLSATSMMTVNIEPVGGASELCVEVALSYPKATFFAGKLIFQRDQWYQHLLHNETALAVQRRLQWLGYSMVVLPVRVWAKVNTDVKLPESQMPEFVENAHPAN